MQFQVILKRSYHSMDPSGQTYEWKQTRNAVLIEVIDTDMPQVDVEFQVDVELDRQDPRQLLSS